MNRRRLLQLAASGAAGLLLRLPETLVGPASVQAADPGEFPAGAAALYLPLISFQGPYSFQDDFRTPLTAGSLQNSPATPGPGLRLVNDTALQAAVTGGELVVQGTAPGSGNPAVKESQTVTRALGQACAFRFRVALGKQLTPLGLFSQAGAPAACVFRGAAQTDGGLRADSTVYTNLFFSYDGCLYEWIAILRPNGAAYYLNDGSWPRLVYLTDQPDSTPLMFGVSAAGGESQDLRTSSWRAYSNPIALQALASDSFNRTDGALAGSLTDGQGHAEGGSGAGLAWTDHLGTAMISAGTAHFSSLPAGIGIATVDCGSADLFIRARASRSAGSVGLVFRYSDPNNYFRWHHDGSKINLDVYANGINYHLFDEPLAFVNGAEIAFKVEGLHWAGFYNGVRKALSTGFDSSFSQSIPGTRCGLYATAAGSTLDNFCVFSAVLPASAFPGQTLLTARQVWCVGDSLTYRPTGYQDTLRKALGDGWVTIDHGISGGEAAVHIANWFGEVGEHNPHTVILLAGVNDLVQGRNDTQVIGALQSLYDRAKATGARVAAVTMTPWKNNFYWNTTRQAYTNTINGWILGKPANVDYVVNAFAALTAGDDTMKPAYDSGDHLHLSAAGYAVLGSTIFNSVSWA